MPGTSDSRRRRDGRAARRAKRAAWPAGGASLLLLVASAVAATASPAGAAAGLRPGATSPLHLDAYAAPTRGSLPLDVYFQANVSGGSGIGAVVAWTFGDGTSGSGLSLRHLYTSSGNFTVEVSASDSGGNSASTRLSVNVSDLPGTSSSTSGSSPALGPVEIGTVFGAGVAVGTIAVGLVAWWRRSPRGRGSTGWSSELVPPPPSPSSAAPGASEPVAVAPTGLVAPVAPIAPRRRSSELILLHLARLGPIADDRIAERGRSQRGIVEALDLPQNVVSPTLRRLENGGALRSELRHVTGEARRLKVYALTPLGKSLAVDLIRRADSVREEPGASRPAGPRVGTLGPAPPTTDGSVAQRGR